MTALAQTALLPADRLRQYQHGLLEPLLRHAARHVPFYRDRLAPILEDDGGVDFARWVEIPILDRAAAQAAGGALCTDALPSGNEHVVEGFTAGSTGTPLRFRRSNLAHLATRCQAQRAHDWCNVDCAQTLAHIGDFRDSRAVPPQGLKLESWSLRGDGEYVALDLRTPLDEQIDWLQRLRPRYLLTYPSQLRRLADSVLASGRVGLFFDAVFTSGEPLAADVRAKTQRAFGARVFDRYSAQEIGYLAAECPDCGQYHLAAESALLEILREDGAPAGPGETGRLIVTPFYNYAMPLIRYDLGDFVEAGMPGTCLRRLPTLRRILGRARNRFIMPDGARVWPAARGIDLRRFVGGADVQMVQTAPGMIEVRYVNGVDAAEPNEVSVREHVRAALHSDLTVRTLAVQAIPRLPSGKAEDYVSLAGQEPAPP
jgi:phenylacetate-CoA ligase